jgi:carbamoyltransferase
MEFGPRALGNTSILLDPRQKDLIKSVNLRLKRTEFMPFAPSIMIEYFDQYFATSNESLQPFYFMAMTCNVLPSKRLEIPAVTHVDGTARPQIVSRDSNTFFYNILDEFRKISGVPLVVNTSFNIHEEPIIRNSESAFQALVAGAIDILFIANRKYTNRAKR